MLSVGANDNNTETVTILQKSAIFLFPFLKLIWNSYKLFTIVILTAHVTLIWLTLKNILTLNTLVISNKSTCADDGNKSNKIEI